MKGGGGDEGWGRRCRVGEEEMKGGEEEMKGGGGGDEGWGRR